MEKRNHTRSDKVSISRLITRVYSTIMNAAYVYQGHTPDPATLHDPFLFVLFGGAEVIINYLMSEERASENRSTDIDIIGKCMTILKELSFNVACLNRGLGQRSDVLRMAVDFMKNQKTFDGAVGLVEELIVGRDEVVLIPRVVPQLGEVLTMMSPRQLSLVCRVLALLVYENEEKKQELLEEGYFDANKFEGNGAVSKREEIRAVRLLRLRRLQCPDTPEGTVEDQNHKFLVGVPKFISRLVRLLRMGTEANTSYPNAATTVSTNPDPYLVGMGAMTESVEEWQEGNSRNDASTIARRTEEERDAETMMARLLQRLMLDQRDRQSPPPPISEADRANRLDPWATIKAATLAVHQVEVLFVLCSMMGGKHRKMVQDACTAEDLAGTMCVVFDGMIWDSRHKPHELEDHERPHGPECQCNQESTAKIQFLRWCITTAIGTQQRVVTKTP